MIARALTYAGAWAAVNAVFFVVGWWTPWAGFCSAFAVALSYALRAILEDNR